MGSNGIKSMKMHRTVLLTTDAVLTKLHSFGPQYVLPPTLPRVQLPRLSLKFQ